MATFGSRGESAAIARSSAGRLRFHHSTRLIGRTLQCASTRCGASAPAPTMHKVSASLRASQSEAAAEFAAVLRRVSIAPSMPHKGSPVWPSNSR